MKRIFLLCFCLLMSLSFSLLFFGCEKTEDTSSRASISADKTIGEGEKSFFLTVVDENGEETVFEINTDKKYVGESLAELGLIDGDEGPYGLYVKTVNGKTFDYDRDKKYWAFYADGELVMSGVDSAEIEDGKNYSFKVE